MHDVSPGQNLNTRPSLEKSWAAFYAIQYEFLRNHGAVMDWLCRLESRASPPARHPRFWDEWFVNHHAERLLGAENPLHSVGVLLAVRLPSPQVFRFVFPWSLAEFRSRRTLFGPRDRGDGWIPEAQALRHIHTQMNFSFGDLRPVETASGLPLYDSMMRAAFESGATVYCSDVFEKLRTDEPTEYGLDGPDGNVLFRSTERRAQGMFGLRTVIYLPCKYRQVGDSARGFCLALYSPVPGLFGAHEGNFAPLEEPAWLESLRREAVVERLYDALVECDRTARFTTRVIMNSVYSNVAQRAKAASARITHAIADEVSEAKKEAVSSALRDFVGNSHIAAFVFLEPLSGLPVVTTGELGAVLARLARDYGGRQDLALEVAVSALVTELRTNDTVETSAMSPTAKRIQIIVQAFLDNAAEHARKVDGRASATLAITRRVHGRWAIEVSNPVDYPTGFGDVRLLERYWWVREALAPPARSGAGSGNMGIQLFLIMCLCDGSGLEPEILLDVPDGESPIATWRARVSFEMRCENVV